MHKILYEQFLNAKEYENDEAAIMLIANDFKKFGEDFIQKIRQDKQLSAEEKRSVEYLVAVHTDINYREAQNYKVLGSLDYETSINDGQLEARRCWPWKAIRKALVCGALSAAATGCWIYTPNPGCILLSAAAVDCWRRPCRRF